MLLIMHYNDRDLPDQRAELYQKAVDVILRPDNVPDIKVREEIEKRIAGSLSMNREMLQHLAYYMHARGKEQGREIDEESSSKFFESEQAYKPYVNALIQQTRQRGTLLEESGGLYRFMHFSFQEFLVGRYLAQNYKDADDLVAFLEGGHIQDPWWREPILLLVGYQDLTAPSQARRTLLRMAGLDEFANKREITLDNQLSACELAVTAYLECRSQAPDLGEKLSAQLINLHEQTGKIKQWSPPILAAAMDSLDRLAYVPKDLHTFIQVGYFWIGKYPVTNLQYERFLKAENFENKALWIDFPKFSEPDKNGKIKHVGDWGDEAWIWLRKVLNSNDYDIQNGILLPRYWRGLRFGVAYKTAPVVGISWYEANAYCKWLITQQEINELRWFSSITDQPIFFRLPTETEWVAAAGEQECGTVLPGINLAIVHLMKKCLCLPTLPKVA